MKFYNNALDCCPNLGCSNNGKCKSCILKHKSTDSLPFCMFPNNDGDMSLKHFYEKLGKWIEKNERKEKG